MKIEKIIEKVKENTDLFRYPFDEFWFNIGFDKAEEEILKLVDEISANYGIDIPAKLLIKKVKEIK